MNLDVHEHALEYLSIHLSLRDRKEIIRVLCHSNPDHLTTAVRHAFNAYEPIIRDIHDAVDLSETLSDLEAFLDDLFKTAKVQVTHTSAADTSATPAFVPSIGEFVQLLRRHSKSLHKFLHQVCKNNPELAGWYVEYAKSAAQQFRRETSETEGAGNMTEALNRLFANLSPKNRDNILILLDRHSTYLDKTHRSSVTRLDSVLGKDDAFHSPQPILELPIPARPQNKIKIWRAGSRLTVPPSVSDGLQGGKMYETKGINRGPGAFLGKWKDLLDHSETSILEPEAIGWDAQKAFCDVHHDKHIVMEQMGGAFRKELARRGCEW